jgi:hypothetical protein
MDTEDFAGLPEEVFNELYPLPEEAIFVKDRKLTKKQSQWLKEWVEDQSKHK